MVHVLDANQSFLDILSQLEPVASVIKLLSNPQIPNNALAYGSGHYYGILGLLYNLITSLRALTITN